jgi:hypothetical protein
MRAVDNLQTKTKGKAATRPYLDALQRYQQACGEKEAKPGP